MKTSGSNGTNNKGSKVKGKEGSSKAIVENMSAKGGSLGFGGKLFAGTRGFDPVTIIL